MTRVFRISRNACMSLFFGIIRKYSQSIIITIVFIIVIVVVMITIFTITIVIFIIVLIFFILKSYFLFRITAMAGQVATSKQTQKFAPDRYFLPTNMVSTKIPRKLPMREQNTKSTVTLDVVPVRRTRRFPRRFRPVVRFCELRFRYLSPPTGSEGEISRPLDHMRQIPFIHSARPISFTTSIFIDQCCRYFPRVVRSRVACYILVTRASDRMAAHDPRLWETLQDFSQNLAIWTSRRMLLEQRRN